ncbi:RTA1 like protein-domain-containing protein [Rhodocollybia butyracea]|uniref:RTA1 like protein-domain-containing protein n=1 Tax=Rhodocollybia butyracea TaxID=206335 RepID=A0A9P5PYA1_9AGAR|nr:RTA1 like protein-domain-containing protein [Rhodocollybia butyracea]KAF9072113.1 RTA1 like protein-domain-containing protein [Rhodocollybia butyracea]
MGDVFLFLLFSAGFIFKVWPAVIGIVLYGISGGIHWIHLYRVGQRYMLVLTIGMACMTLGMILRIAVAHSPFSLGLYIIMDMFVLLSPCAFLATNYMLLSRLANSLGRDIADDCLLISSRRITKIFVWSDVITFWIQAAGGGLSAEASLSKVGTDIAMAGLILQLISYSLFTLLLVMFGFKVRSKYPQAWQVRDGEKLFAVAGPFRISPITNWKILYFTMCVTCVGILVRSIFRIAEFAGGYFGFLAVHEGFFFCLDALPLWLAMSLYCFLWPSRFINKQAVDISARGSPVDIPLSEKGKSETSSST